nr:hypothetical protein [Tanacetum cinerariifolium]
MHMALCRGEYVTLRKVGDASHKGIAEHYNGMGTLLILNIKEEYTDRLMMTFSIFSPIKNLLPAMLAQVGNQGNVGNQNGHVVNENVQENIRNVLINGNRVGCSYKEFLACNPKEYDGKGGAIVLTRWIEKMELVPHLVTPESRKIERYVYGLTSQICGMVAATEPKTIQKVLQISGALTDEAIRNGSIKKVEKKGNVGEPSKDKSGVDDNKRTMTGNVFASTVNPVGRENTGVWPKCTTCNSYHAPGGPYRTCFNYNYLGDLAKDCRGVPRNVNPVNARNPTVRACYECGSTDHGHGNQGNQARGSAFMLGAEEACQDMNIMTGIEPSELGFRFEIEIASGQLVEIDKVIKSYKLEIESHVFDIDLIPFGHGSFDVIIGMDCLSNHKAEIIYHEKVVRIPLLDGKVLRVLGERPKEKTLEDMLRAYVLDFKRSWDVHLLKCHSLIMWAEVEEGQLIGPELVQETTEKILQIKDRLKVTRDCQKSYADKKRKPLEFSVDLPEELNGVHDTFHVSNLKKCLADPTLQVPLYEIQVDAKLNFVKEPIEILEGEFKKLKRSRIFIIKVRWNSKRGPEFTWERKDQMKL